MLQAMLGRADEAAASVRWEGAEEPPPGPAPPALKLDGPLKKAIFADTFPKRPDEDPTAAVCLDAKGDRKKPQARP